MPERLRSPALEKGFPPGQHYVNTFPLYDIVRRRPVFDPVAYRFRVSGAVDNPFELTWDELMQRPSCEVVAEFHCVTGWSKEPLTWEGIPTKPVVELARPKSNVVQVMAQCLEGYTTNVPLNYLLADDTILAFRLNGQPLTPEHGAPLRLLVPQLYGWKSAKYLTGLDFQTEWRGGFWEVRGYHLVGDPWEEQRYSEPLERVKEWWRKVRVTSVERPNKR